MVCWRACFKIVLLDYDYKFDCVEVEKIKEQPFV